MHLDEKPTTMTLGWVASLPPRLSRRLTTIILAITVLCLTLFLLTSNNPDVPPLAVSWLASKEDGSSLINLPECGPERKRVASPEIWNAAEAKYQHLMDDKFTCVYTLRLGRHGLSWY